MKYLILILLSSSVFASTEWIAGTDKFQLEKVGDDGYASRSCLKSCKLRELVKSNKKKLSGTAISGGKDPASVLCKEIGAEVFYLSHSDLSETFCKKDGDMISLSILLNDF